MLTQDCGEYWVACDGCSDMHDLDERNFDGAVRALRRAGYQTIRNDAERKWEHICPSCQLQMHTPQETVRRNDGFPV